MTMKLGKVLAWEFRRTVRGKQFLIMTILIPAILGLSAGGYALFGGTREAPAGPPPPFLAPLVISMILFFGAFLNGAMSLYAVIKEKSSRVVEIVLSSVSARELMAGKVLGQGAAGLIQVILWGAIAIVVLGRLAPGLSWELSVVQWISYPLYFVLGSSDLHPLRDGRRGDEGRPERRGPVAHRDDPLHPDALRPRDDRAPERNVGSDP
jgi:ABC-type Na+ efflux pump permease subunit